MGTLAELALGRARKFIVFSFLIFAPYYLYWRLGTFNPEALVFSWVIWLAEVFGYLTAAIHVFMVYRLTSPVSAEPTQGLSVAVFIPTYNESTDLVRHTVAASKRMDYAHETWLLDDGDRPEMRALAEELGCFYLRRDNNEHAKAGNLNNALRHTSADYIAIFDADHVPGKDFLSKTLGFFKDEQVAFVQTPQDFYNLDSFQHRKHKRLNHIWTEQSLFFRVIQRGKDRWNAAFFCGSCAVVRRSALDNIGGFATGTITEDLHTSIRIHKKGYRSIYYPESLAFGVAPDSIKEFLLQRLRWGQGAMQVWRKEGIVFNTRLTIAQKLNYVASIATYFDGWQKLIFYFSPIVVLVSGIMPINVLGLEFLLHFVPYYLLCFWAYEEVGRGYGRSIYTEEFNMARFAIFAWATLGLLFDNRKFRVTDKNHDSADDSFNIVPQLTVLFGSGVAIIVGIALWMGFSHMSQMALWVNVLWASVNMGLAGFVTRVTLSRKHRRKEYRFTVPLAGQLRLPGGALGLGVMSNISSNGCAFVCEKPILSKDVIAGEIWLPGKKVGFEADIRFTNNQNTENRDPDLYEYGLNLRWKTAEDQEAVESFLFGTDVQWRMLNLHERGATPVVNMKRWLTGHGPRGFGRTYSNAWKPVVYESIAPNEAGGIGVLFHPNEANLPARFVTTDKLAASAEFKYRELGSNRIKTVRGNLANVEEVDTESGLLYTADFNAYPQFEKAGSLALDYSRAS